MVKLFIILCSIVFFFNSCDFKQDSLGDFDIISVFADSTNWMEFKDALNGIYGKQYKTPRPEREFLIKWKSHNFFEKFKQDRNIIFLCSLDSNDPVSTVVKNTLSPEVIQGVNSDEFFYIPKPNSWAQNQYVVFLVAPNKTELLQRMNEYKDIVYKDFVKSYFERYEQQIFQRNENKELEEYLLEHFPFKVRIPSDFFIANESLEKQYVYLRRLYPDRSFSVHWVPFHDSVKITFDWIINERNKLAEHTFSGDKIVEEETTFNEVNFLNRSAYWLEGTWQNPELVIGGPFRNITFIDEQSQFIFMIDYYVQAIDRRKKLFLDQMEIMAKTFKTKMEIEAEKGEK